MDVNPAEVARKPTLGSSILLCMELAGFDLDKEVPGLKVDKAQFSRWKSGEEGIKWPKLVALMDACGNDAPLLWMLHARGFDLGSLRRRETELERRLRLVEEENAALRRVLSSQRAG